MRSQTAAVFLALVCVPAFAQGEKVFKESDVNESALIEALTPRAKQEPMLTRSIKIQRDQAPVAPPQPAKAAVLITFETNSAQLSPQAKRSLDVVGRALAADSLAQFAFSIEGHADPRGGAELNQRLSTERAQAVRTYLVQTAGISAERLTAVGKGDKELLNESDPTAPENRRVTIVTRDQ